MKPRPLNDAEKLIRGLNKMAMLAKDAGTKVHAVDIGRDANRRFEQLLFALRTDAQSREGREEYFKRGVESLAWVWREIDHNKKPLV